VQTFIKVLISS